MTTLIETLIKDAQEELQIKKEGLIKEALVRAGYPDIAESFCNTRFPKVASVYRGYWTYFFADNGTKDGEFIIAISAYEMVTTKEDPCKITIKFNYHTDKTRVEL